MEIVVWITPYFGQMRWSACSQARETTREFFLREVCGSVAQGFLNGGKGGGGAGVSGILLFFFCFLTILLLLA